MATSVRGGTTNGGREKRGTSPSSSSPLVKKSPKPALSSSTSSSSPSPSGKSGPTMDRKQSPSYLRHTKSSKTLDSPMGPKRSDTDSSAKKPTPPRRRSFDRPPPASQVQKALHSSTGAREARTLRSSSFSVKSTTSSPSSTRGGIERQASLGKTPVRDKKVEPQLSKSRSLSKITVASKVIPKGSSRVAPKKKGPKSVTSESSNECDSHSVEHLVSDDDMGYSINHENQSLPEISEMPDSNEELKDPTSLEVEAKQVEEGQDHKDKGGEEEKQGITENHDENHDDDDDQEGKPTAAEEVTDEPAVAPQEIETPQKEEDQPAVETQPEVDHVRVDEKPADGDHQAEVQSTEEKSDQTGEGGETEEEQPKVDPIDTVPKEKEEESPAKEEEKSEEKTAGAEEKDQKQSVRRSPSPPVRPQPAVGKKENQAYNDVIEQTANKLRGKRSKVLALAGAFETVISLQDTNKN